MKKQILFGLVAGLVGVIGLLLVYILLLSIPSRSMPVSDATIIEDHPITVIDPPLPMPDFTLTSTDNQTFSLSDLTPQPVIMAFGFTHCPDVCPITLNEMRTIHEVIGDDIHYAFISVDGERDTPEALTTYFTSLGVDAFMIGLTGSEADVRAMGEPYGLEFILEEPNRFGNYNVAHTAGMFLLDAERGWIRRYRFGMRPRDIIDDLQAILNR